MLIALGAVLIRFSDWESIVLIAQFYIGGLQMTGSLCSILWRGPFFNEKLLHFGISVAFLLVLAVVQDLPNINFLYKYILIVPSWLLASFYYYLSFKRMQIKAPTGKFLPHINF